MTNSPLTADRSYPGHGDIAGAPGGESPPPKTAASWLFAGGLALTGLLSGTGITAPISEPPVRYIGEWTSTARVAGPVGFGDPRPSGRRPADAATPPIRAVSTAMVVEPADRSVQGRDVRWLHEASGLTWEQLGRVFGVSRRAVHLWANGGRMNASNAELLGELLAVVRALPGPPDTRRAALLASSAGESSVVDRLRARNRSDTRDVSGTPFRPEELLGVHDRVDGTGSGVERT